MIRMKTKKIDRLKGYNFVIPHKEKSIPPSLDRYYKLS